MNTREVAANRVLSNRMSCQPTRLVCSKVKHTSQLHCFRKRLGFCFKTCFSFVILLKVNLLKPHISPCFGFGFRLSQFNPFQWNLHKAKQHWLQLSSFLFRMKTDTLLIYIKISILLMTFKCMRRYIASFVNHIKHGNES